MSRTIPAITAGVLLLLIAASALASHLPFVPDLLTRISKDGGAGSAHWLLFLTIQIGVATIGFVPASLMAIVAGATYGLYQGFLISSISLMIGGSLAFGLSRSVLRPWIEGWVSRHPRFVRLEQAVNADGWRFVCLVRLSPVMPFALTSYCLGLTTINHRSFTVGTLASLPALACYVATGALGHASWQLGNAGIDYVSFLLLLTGVAATLLIAWRIRHFLSKSMDNGNA
jgi:uncharacterized membrane protein YdjX (TVP38/TMEM64 family)